MMKLIQILCTFIILGASMLNLSGCGQTGPLYLPEIPAAKPLSGTDSPTRF